MTGIRPHPRVVYQSLKGMAEALQAAGKDTTSDRGGPMRGQPNTKQIEAHVTSWQR
ncbi:BQ5605_C006g03787 [Microbotryum silenes-dioicae]|uniref:BQ5605_C006g03787 protein n=1 Tax=Microbotryum silenes-dioicae TaxID=796604 RepID=A0A2X0P184_9BASI|nr:BQ5605_C006g03787 [Microbotryum silenes-dioicae]